MFTTYAQALAHLQAINARVKAATIPDHRAFEEQADFLAAREVWRATLGQISADAKAAGFVRLFDGRYRLTPAHTKLA